MKNAQAEPKAKGRKPTAAQKKMAEKIFGESAKLELPPEIEIIPEQREAERRHNVDAMIFSVQQLQTPVAENSPTTPAPETPKAPPEAIAQFQVELEKLQKQFGVRIAPAMQPKAKEKLQSHGITRPAPDTLCGKIWSICDFITASQNGVAATIQSVRLDKSLCGVNDHTIKTQYARWRKYNGVTGRIPMVAPVPQAVGEDDGLSVACRV